MDANKNTAKFEEDKFIVINRKFIEELDKKFRCDFHPHCGYVKNLLEALDWFAAGCKKELGVDLAEKKYIVCNQDEPYSDEILNIILRNK